ncbi:MAG: CheR family methyltransferase [Calditerrivibrio sp.]|uniref:CheR family methyltransferase n=1 Tax=Calditerrivibrio sp. TaxID=2792612 RepID=UPI003D10545F
MKTLKDLYRATTFVELICRFIEVNYGIKITETNSDCLLKILYSIFNRYPETEEELDFFVKFYLRDCLWNNESYFFRNKAQLEELVKIAKRDLVRVLSFGCAEGQEPYSISIVLTDKGIKHKIYAVDLDEIAINKAKTGIYTPFDLRNFDEKYTWAFSVDGEYIRIREELKENVEFLHINCLKEPLEKYIRQKVDVIFCNNVMIYLTDNYKKNIIKQFCNLLEYDGYIFTTHEEKSNFVMMPGLVNISDELVLFKKKNISHIIEKDLRDLYLLSDNDEQTDDEVLIGYENDLKDNFNVEILRRLVTLNINKERFDEAKKWQYLVLISSEYNEDDIDLYLEICRRTGDMEELIDMLLKKISIFKKEKDILLLINIAKDIGNADLYFTYKNLYESLFNKNIF